MRPVISKLEYSALSTSQDGIISFSVLWKTSSIDRMSTYRPGQKNCSLFPAKTLKAYKIKIHRRTGGYSISLVDTQFSSSSVSIVLPLWKASLTAEPNVNITLITQKILAKPGSYQRSTTSFRWLMTTEILPQLYRPVAGLNFVSLLTKNLDNWRS